MEPRSSFAFSGAGGAQIVSQFRHQRNSISLARPISPDRAGYAAPLAGVTSRGLSIQPESSSSSTCIRGSKRKTENIEGDVDYDDEGTRVNEISRQVFGGREGAWEVFEINIDELDEEMITEAIDDVNGENLDPKKVAESRNEEIDFMRTRGYGKSCQSVHAGRSPELDRLR